MRVFDENRLAECAVALSTRLRLADTTRAFDGVAREYHASNEANPILRHMRRRSIARALEVPVHPQQCRDVIHCGVAPVRYECGRRTRLRARRSQGR